MPSSSRYKNARAFDPPPDGSEAFPGIRPREIGPATGVIEHVVKAGERLDHLARHYYGDDRLWWRILDANPELIFGLPLMPVPDSAGPAEDLVGTILLIPRAREV